jgi:hypothetical protein
MMMMMNNAQCACIFNLCKFMQIQFMQRPETGQDALNDDDDYPGSEFLKASFLKRVDFRTALSPISTSR